MRKNCAFTQCRTRLWERLLSAPSLRSCLNSREEPIGGMGAHDFTARHGSSTHIALRGRRPLADWFAYPSSSFDGRRFPLHNSPSWILLVSLSVLTRPRPNVVHTCIISGSFPLNVNKQTQQTCASLPLPIPPDLWVFMCFTRVRASPCATYVASIRCVVFRAPRSPSPNSFLHCSSVFPCLVNHKSQPSPKCLHKQPASLDDDHGVPQPSLSLNH